MSEPHPTIEDDPEGPLADEGTELQFDEAEPTTPTSSGPACAGCKRPIKDAYFEINGKVVCAACRHQIEAAFHGGSAVGRVIKAIVYGAAGTVVGAIIYYAILFSTEINLGLVAVLVGFIVGRAVRKGSENRGGSFYQVLAVFLTYTAIALMDVVLWPDSSPEPVQQPVVPQPTWVNLANAVYLLYKSPVLFGIDRPISGLIYCFALLEAWRINARATLAFNGPFQISAVPAAQTPEVLHDGE